MQPPREFLEEDKKWCIDLPANKFKETPECSTTSKLAPFLIPTDLFEDTLLVALQIVGVNAIPK